MPEFSLMELTSSVRKFMMISGQFLPPKDPLKIARWFITAGSLVTLTIFASVELVISAATQLGSALEIITILLTFLEMCFRVFYLSSKEGEMMKMITAFQYFPVTCASFSLSERTMQTRSLRRSKRTFLLFSGYIFMVLTGYLSLPFLPRGPDLSALGFAPSDITASIVNPARERPLYIPMWVPDGEESLQSPGYEVLVCWQAWSFVVLVCVFCASDCLLYTFIIYIVEGMHHLERVGPGHSHPGDFGSLTLSKSVLNSRGQVLHSQLSSEPQILLNKNKVQGPGARNKRRGQEMFKRAETEYKIWVIQHQFLLNLAIEVRRFFSPIIWGTFFINGAVLCVLAYVLVKLRDVVGILCVFGHFSCILIKLYVMATFGEELREESTRLPTTVVDKVYPRLGATRRNDASIISLRCKNPVTLTGLGFFDLSVEIFGRVCSVALSYFIVLLQLH